MFNKIPLLITVITLLLMSACNKNTHLGKTVRPHLPNTSVIKDIPLFSQCTLSSNLKLTDNNVPFVVNVPVQSNTNSLNEFSVEFSSKYKGSTMGLVDIEWTVNGEKIESNSPTLYYNMEAGKEYDIVCSVFSTNYRSVYKKDVSFCATKDIKAQKIKFNECKPFEYKETNCLQNNGAEKKESINKANGLVRAIVIVLPYQKNNTI